jgi:hypothetical protein
MEVDMASSDHATERVAKACDQLKASRTAADNKDAPLLGRGHSRLQVAAASTVFRSQT